MSIGGIFRKVADGVIALNKPLLRTVLFYVLWLLVHHFSSNLYADLCAPKGLQGIFFSSFTVTTPHCTSLRWLVRQSSLAIESMWFLLGSFFSIQLLHTM